MNIPLFKVFMSPDAGKNTEAVLQSGFITQGPKVEEFERCLQDYFNYPYILTLNSATSGLTLAIRLAKDHFADTNITVLSTPLTCTATNWPILANNLQIKWIDIDPNTCNIDLTDLVHKMDASTKIIVLVHWGGYPINMDKLNELKMYSREKYGFEPIIIEDCAHAFGAKYNDKFLGTFGNIAVFSLQAIKHLTTGDGGLIFLPNKETYEKAKLLRWFGIDRNKWSGNNDFRLEPNVTEWGYKFHMNDINATIGLSNVPFVKENIERCRMNAAYYFKELHNIKGVHLLENSHNCNGAWWIYTLRIKDKNGFMKYMKEHGIITSQVHGRNDLHECVKEFKTPLPQLDMLENEIVCIPVGWWVSNDDRAFIVQKIKDWANIIV